MTGRRRQLRYQLAPSVPRRPRTGLPPAPAPGTMIAGPDTIWREPASRRAGPEDSTANKHENNRNV